MLQPPFNGEMTTGKWNIRRKITATISLTLFITVCSLFIGVGIFQIAAKKNVTFQPVNRETILGLLAEDAEFVKLARDHARYKQCANTSQKISVAYEPKLRPSQLEGESACLHFGSTHPTGRPIDITISITNDSRETVVNKESKQFSYVQVDLLSRQSRIISRLVGVLQGTPTTIYVIQLDARTVVVHYSPTSPTLDAAVEQLAYRINSLPAHSTR